MRREGARVGCAAPGRASGVVYAAKRPLRAAARSSGSPASRAMTVCEAHATALEDGVLYRVVRGLRWRVSEVQAVLLRPFAPARHLTVAVRGGPGRGGRAIRDDDPARDLVE